MPLFVKAGAILPLDPVRQHTGEETKEPLTLRIYRGADGMASLYQDDGSSNAYLKGESALTSITWDDKAAKLTLAPRTSPAHRQVRPQAFRVELVPSGQVKTVDYAGEAIEIGF